MQRTLQKPPEPGGLFLSEDDLLDLTHKFRRPARVRALNMMGIDHKVRPDGTIAVLRAHVEKVFGGTIETAKSKKAKEWEPDWGAMPGFGQPLYKGKK